MEQLDKILSSIKKFLSSSIYTGETTHISMSTLITIIFTLILVSVVLRLVHKFVTKKLPSDDKNKFISIFNFLRYLLYILVIIIVLHSSGVNMTALLTASAALFVGLGFALQYLFQDIISGILMIMDQSLHVGDIIDMDGKIGRVFEIKLRTTRALTRDDKVIVIPNHIFLTNSIYNYTQNHNMTREAVKVGVAYGSDVSLVTKILEGVVQEQRGVLKSPKPFVLFDDFGDSALMFSINFYISDSYGDPKIKSEVRYKIDSEFRANNITIPFPQRDVHVFQPRPFEHVSVSKTNKEWGLGED
ncbi:MAG: mechanosensitive ion channel [Maribacter sp.]|nr:mechanosensitive ion channel [Maribacter sp.]